MSRYDSFGLNGYQQLNDACGDVEKLKHMIDAIISTFYGTDLLDRIDMIAIQAEVADGGLDQQLNYIELEYFEHGDHVHRQTRLENEGYSGRNRCQFQRVQLPKQSYNRMERMGCGIQPACLCRVCLRRKYTDRFNLSGRHPEYVDPDLPEKLESYCQLIDGRYYKHTAAVDYTLEGDCPNPPYVETCCMEVILEDGTTMYAVVVFREDVDGCGVTNFDLYTECPW